MSSDYCYPIDNPLLLYVSLSPTPFQTSEEPQQNLIRDVCTKMISLEKRKRWKVFYEANTLNLSAYFV